jgi:phosphomannomutase
VIEVTDYRAGAEARPPWLGTHDLIAFTLDEGRVMIRPSGTEPKCKIYVDVRSDVATDATPAGLATAERMLTARADELARDLATIAGL